jgi:hypothetical protein
MYSRVVSFLATAPQRLDSSLFCVVFHRPDLDNASSPLLGGLRPTAAAKQPGNTAFSDLASNKIVVGDCLVPKKRARS